MKYLVLLEHQWTEDSEGASKSDDDESVNGECIDLCHPPFPGRAFLGAAYCCLRAAATGTLLS
jgi:hypothetical protein